MISEISCDEGNKVIILPISKKICLELIEEEYYNKKL